MARPWNRLPEETMDAPSLELFYVILQGFEQSGLVKHVPVHPAEGLEHRLFEGPLQSKPFCDFSVLEDEHCGTLWGRVCDIGLHLFGKSKPNWHLSDNKGAILRVKMAIIASFPFPDNKCC